MNVFRGMFRLSKYWLLRLRRLKGDPEHLARGVGFGVFMGVLPLAPIQTILIVPLSVLLRASTVAAVVSGILVSNPLTFMPQYYVAWKLGNAMLPGWISWEQLQAALAVVSEQGMLEGLAAIGHLGAKAIAVIQVGGAVIGLPAGAASYFLALSFFRRLRERRRRKSSAADAAGKDAL